MRRVVNARIAGATFLGYIAVAAPAAWLSGRATGSGETAAKLASMAAHAGDMQIASLLSLASCFAAIILAVTLYGITRDEDPELAMLGLCCRLGEGILGATQVLASVRLFTLATTATTQDALAAQSVASFLFQTGGVGTNLCATFFAVGSTAFCWLLLRGRMIPRGLAWLGLLASLLLVVGLPLRLTGIAPASIGMALWLPMAAFEIPLGVWMLVKGVRPPAARPVAARMAAGTVEPA